MLGGPSWIDPTVVIIFLHSSSIHQHLSDPSHVAITLNHRAWDWDSHSIYRLNVIAILERGGQKEADGLMKNAERLKQVTQSKYIYHLQLIITIFIEMQLSMLKVLSSGQVWIEVHQNTSFCIEGRTTSNLVIIMDFFKILLCWEDLIMIVCR